MHSAAYLKAHAEATELSRERTWVPAIDAWQRVTTANPTDGAHWAALAEACFEAGDFGPAEAAYRRARELGVGATWDDIAEPGAVEYRIACCRARLDEPDGALTAFAESVAQGYRSPETAWDDEHLRTLRSDPRFAELVARPSEGLTREEGWAFDADLLVREIERRAPTRTPAERELLERRHAALVGSIPGLTDAQIVVELMRWVASLDDGHGTVQVMDEGSSLSASLPLQLYLFEEGLHVTAAHPSQTSLLGARILSYDGRPVSEVLALVDPLTNRDNASGARERIVQVMRRTCVLHAVGAIDVPDAVHLEVELQDCTQRVVRIAAMADPWITRNALPAPPGWVCYHSTLPGEAPLCLRHLDRPFWFEDLPSDGLLYCQLNAISDDEHEPLAGFVDRMFGALDAPEDRRLVLDLRWNGGGNLTLIQPLIHGLIRRPAISRPGGLFVIVGRRTFSAAHYTCSAIEANTHALFVGEPTGSRPNFVGESTPFRLPFSGLRVNVSDTCWQNSWPHDRRTHIAPDLCVPPTFAAYRSLRDDAMEAILEASEM